MFMRCSKGGGQELSQYQAKPRRVMICYIDFLREDNTQLFNHLIRSSPTRGGKLVCKT